MIITKISTQARDPERANVYVDGKFYAGLNKLVVLQLGLTVGQQITPALAAQLSQSESSQNIWDYSLISLSASPKSRRQMVSKLAGRFSKEEAEATVGRLEEAGLVDDPHLAEMLVNHHLQNSSKSTREIEAALIQKGLPREIVKTALGTIPVEYELETAIRLSELKAGRDVVDERIKVKIAQYLGRKGFDYSVIRKALQNLGGDIE